MDPTRIHAHLFRSTYPTKLLRGGVDIVTVSKQLGHSDLKVTMRYLAALEDKTLQAKVNQVWAD